MCGGVGRPSQLAVRRRLATGHNFDFTTGYDLGNNVHQQHVLQYITKSNVLVVLMAPSCRTLGPTSNLNYKINYDTWLKHYQEDMPHVHFCGRVAMLQIQLRNFFFAENPWPTHLINEGKWPQVLKHSEIEVIQQDMLGQKGPHGFPSKRPTAWGMHAVSPSVFQQRRIQNSLRL